MTTSITDTPLTNYPKTKIWLSVWLSFMLILVASLHTIELNSSEYVRRNELVLIEFTLLMIVLLIGISNLISSFFYLAVHNKEHLRPSLTSFFIAVMSLTIAIFIDPQTLLSTPT
ncbi:MAG: hypothetical protein GQ569_14120 [Methylococcaceae bacterium]|nr:hypothetical protein [Methylococcaceae bacterium]